MSQTVSYAVNIAPNNCLDIFVTLLDPHFGDHDIDDLIVKLVFDECLERVNLQRRKALNVHNDNDKNEIIALVQCVQEGVSRAIETTDAQFLSTMHRSDRSQEYQYTIARMIVKSAVRIADQYYSAYVQHQIQSAKRRKDRHPGTMSMFRSASASSASSSSPKSTSSAPEEAVHFDHCEALASVSNLGGEFNPNPITPQHTSFIRRFVSSYQRPGGAVPEELKLGNNWNIAQDAPPIRSHVTTDSRLLRMAQKFASPLASTKRSQSLPVA